MGRRLELGNVSPQSPVTGVSWFAACAYAHWKGKRLPKFAEWEYAAAASPARPHRANDAEFQKHILLWYSTAAPKQLPAVGSGLTNFFGTHDMHGLIWEWVAEFDAPWAADADRA